MITQSMIFLLETLKDIVGSYGLAIITLTVLIRVLLWPVTQSQMRSMRMMQELQPKIKMLQDRFKTEPQKMQGEMMKLYKEHNFNPFSGCLPMLVQLPLFLGLFWAISNPQFMTTGDPVFLSFIHLKHAGIVSHSGQSFDDTMNFAESGKSGFLGFGKDNLVAGNKMTITLKTGTSSERKVPKPNKVFTLTPEKPLPGVPVALSTSLDKLDLAGNENDIASIEMTVINTGTKEMETIQFAADPDTEDLTLKTELQTAPGKPQPHLDVLVLILIFVASMILSQKQMAGQRQDNADDPQQKMMKMLPLLFSGFLFIIPIPAGVLLYMDVNSIFQMVQSWVINRQMEAAKSPAPPSSTVVEVKPE